MPDREKDLPAGYQFGDARHMGRIAIRYLKQWDIVPDPKPWRSDDYIRMLQEHDLHAGEK